MSDYFERASVADLKASGLMSDFDILTKHCKYTEAEAKAMLSRLNLQRMEDIKLQVMAQNPELYGAEMPCDSECVLHKECEDDCPWCEDEAHFSPRDQNTCSATIKGIIFFYLDIGQLPPDKADEFTERVKERYATIINKIKSANYEVMFIPNRHGNTSVQQMML